MYIAPSATAVNTVPVSSAIRDSRAVGSLRRFARLDAATARTRRPASSPIAATAQENPLRARLLACLTLRRACDGVTLMRPLAVLLLTIILVPLALVGAISGLFLLWGRDLPSPHNPQEVEPPRKTVVLDRRGETDRRVLHREPQSRCRWRRFPK